MFYEHRFLVEECLEHLRTVRVVFPRNGRNFTGDKPRSEPIWRRLIFFANRGQGIYSQPMVRAWAVSSRRLLRTVH